MKSSNVFISVLCAVVIGGMFMSNSVLKQEFEKIDLSDAYKNYMSIDHGAYAVLDISGSNGYPIQIVQKDSSAIKVLRSRLDHFKKELRNDTLFVKFTGSNVPLEQRFNSSTPYGIIIESNTLSTIISNNTHNRVFDFKDSDLQVLLKGNSFMEMINCNVNTLEMDLEDSSYINFVKQNKVDSLDLKMNDKSVASLQHIEFKSLHHALSDSITMVLSKDAFNKILK